MNCHTFSAALLYSVLYILVSYKLTKYHNYLVYFYRRRATVVVTFTTRRAKIVMGAEQSVTSDKESEGEPATVVAHDPVPPPPVVPAGPTAADVESYSPEAVVQELTKAALSTDPAAHLEVIEACCKRVRVLCREVDMCKVCDEKGAAEAVVQAMKVTPNNTGVQLQALAALVNLCSGEANEHRTKAVAVGALPAIVKSMMALPDNAEIQEMGCIALQNCCYGEDAAATDRRKGAAQCGAIAAVVKAMELHEHIPAAQEVGVATLRLMVHKVPELRTQAVQGKLLSSLPSVHICPSIRPSQCVGFNMPFTMCRLGVF